MAHEFSVGLKQRRRKQRQRRSKGYDRQFICHMPCTRSLELQSLLLNQSFYTDTMFSWVQSIAGYTCAWLTLTRVYPIASQASVNITAALQDLPTMLRFLQLWFVTWQANKLESTRMLRKLFAGCTSNCFRPCNRNQRGKDEESQDKERSRRREVKTTRKTRTRVWPTTRTWATNSLWASG